MLRDVTNDFVTSRDKHNVPVWVEPTLQQHFLELEQFQHETCFSFVSIHIHSNFIDLYRCLITTGCDYRLK